ncbi:MAG: hypothetical protein IT361_01160 [Gemmatimonadaceae bacterium]|nr:hypothetical protein [Gemmatimonadaceae bacterium]
MSESVASRSRLAPFLAVLGVASLPALIDPGAIARAAALATSVLPGAEFAAAGRLGLVHGVVPLVALSATLLCLAPGLLLAMWFGRSRTATEWVFHGFILSLVAVSLTSAIAEALPGEWLRGRAYAGFLFGLTAVCAALLLSTRRTVTWPLARAADRRDVVSLMVLFGIGAIVLGPKMLWDAFNGDGAHAFESSRLLLRHPLPFWPSAAGPVAGFPGMTTMLYAFPDAWFLRLFGEVEYAVRLPFLVYLPVLACGVRLLGSVGRAATHDDAWPAAGLLASLAAYQVAMAFSATYSPYSADVALPATQDTLLMIACVGMFITTWAGAWGWGALFMVLTYLSLPSGLILVGFWIVARVLVERPQPWPWAWRTVGLLVVTILGTALAARLLVALGAPTPGGEYGLVGILRYFAFLQFTDPARLVYVAVPAGLLPFAVLFAWRSQDGLARALTLVTLAYFLFFFVQAHVSLHHFVPAMVLPMAVAWRVWSASAAGAARRLGPAWVASGLVACVLAWPWGQPMVHRDGREVGAAALVRIPGYAESAPAALHASTLFDRLFAYDWDPAVPGVYGGSPLVWNHYAAHAGEPTAGTNYVVQPTSAPAPVGWRLVGSDSAGASIYVRDDARLALDRARRPATPPGSRWLAVPRGILFHSVALDGGPRIIDVARTLEDWGVDVAPILARLGVRRGS